MLTLQFLSSSLVLSLDHSLCRCCQGRFSRLESRHLKLHYSAKFLPLNSNRLVTLFSSIIVLLLRPVLLKFGGTGAVKRNRKRRWGGGGIIAGAMWLIKQRQQQKFSQWEMESAPSCGLGSKRSQNEQKFGNHCLWPNSYKIQHRGQCTG